jgi:hypothetical protein
MTSNVSHEAETTDKSKSEKLCDPPTVPTIPEGGKCPQPCNCPTPPGGAPSSCLDDLIRSQGIIVKKADRAKAFVDELTAIQGKVTSAQVDYTQKRFTDLRKTWKDQDKLIVELIRKLVCAVDCWECLLECRLCPQLVEIRTLEDRLNGTGVLTKKVYSLFDLQAWHQRNVANMQARVDRINLVLAAWEKPSDTLGDVLDKNGKLIEDTEKILATDSAKAVYDVFMTLLPRHWAIRPRDEGSEKDGKKPWKSEIDPKYINICECKEGQQKGDDKGKDAQKADDKGQVAQSADDKGQDKNECDDGAPDPEKCRCDDGTPDVCCGPDVGILNLRQRLVGPLPYIVDPTLFPDIICCLTSKRLEPASEQLATAQANRDATTAEIELVAKKIADKKSAIEASFRAELSNPIDCTQYKKKEQPNKEPTPTREPEGGNGDHKRADHTAR